MTNSEITVLASIFSPCVNLVISLYFCLRIKRRLDSLDSRLDKRVGTHNDC
jgi:hypothetical protein